MSDGVHTRKPSVCKSIPVAYIWLQSECAKEEENISVKRTGKIHSFFSAEVQFLHNETSL